MNKQTYREWTISPRDRGLAGWVVVTSGPGLNKDFDGIHPKFVAVVEKSALDKANARIEKLRQAIERVTDSRAGGCVYVDRQKILKAALKEDEGI